MFSGNSPRAGFLFVHEEDVARELPVKLPVAYGAQLPLPVFFDVRPASAFLPRFLILQQGNDNEP